MLDGCLLVVCVFVWCGKGFILVSLFVLEMIWFYLCWDDWCLCVVVVVKLVVLISSVVIVIYSVGVNDLKCVVSGVVMSGLRICLMLYEVVV